MNILAKRHISFGSAVGKSVCLKMKWINFGRNKAKKQKKTSMQNECKFVHFQQISC